MVYSFSLFVLVPRSPFPVVVTSLFSSLPPILTLLVANISHFLTIAIKFSCCSCNEICLLCFFPLSPFRSFSVIHVSVDIIKFSRKERLDFVVFSLLMSEWRCDLPPKLMGAWMRKHYGRMVTWRPTFFASIGYHFFVLRCARFACGSVPLQLSISNIIIKNENR